MVDTAKAADLLIAARRDGDIVALEELPQTLDEAYAIQNAIIQQIGVPVVGWKAAFTNQGAMQKMKTTEPAMGPLFEPWVMQSGATVATPDNCLRRVESEYAFRMAAGLPARDKPYARDEVADAVAAVHPAMEVAHTRLEGGLDLGARALIADHCANFAFIYGEGRSDWREVDMTGQEVTLSQDGKRVASGSGSEVMGHPLTSLVWVANQLRKQGRGLKAGELVTTGTCTGMTPAPVNCRLVADFGPLGQCALTLTSAASES